MSTTKNFTTKKSAASPPPARLGFARASRARDHERKDQHGIRIGGRRGSGGRTGCRRGASSVLRRLLDLLPRRFMRRRSREFGDRVARRGAICGPTLVSVIVPRRGTSCAAGLYRHQRAEGQDRHGCCDGHDALRHELLHLASADRSARF